MMEVALPVRRTLYLSSVSLLSGCLALTEDVQLNTDLSQYVTGTSSTPIEVYVGYRTSQFHLDLETDAYVAVDRVLDPMGNVVLDYRDFPSPRLLSQGLIPIGRHASFNWPIRAEDGNLSTGNWTIEVAAIDDDQHYVSDLTLWVHSQTKADGDLEKGRIHARILYDENTGDDLAIRTATEQAVQTWREIYRSAGLEVSVTYEETNLSFDMAAPGDQTDVYQDINSEGEPEQVTIVVGHYIDGELDKLGITGAIPGPLADSPKGVVLISWLALAGKDAEFNALEMGLFGETIAHEVGHYLGLFHPVEETWSDWDFLSDTEECTSYGDCVDDLAENLMFPYPICDGTTCTPQRQLSSDQQGLIHRYTGTL